MIDLPQGGFIFVDAQANSKIAYRTEATRSKASTTLSSCRYHRVSGISDQTSIQVSRKAREKLSNTGFIMYSKNVRSPVLM
jgi:hypothetical protein